MYSSLTQTLTCDIKIFSIRCPVIWICLHCVMKLNKATWQDFHLLLTCVLTKWRRKHAKNGFWKGWVRRHLWPPTTTLKHLWHYSNSSNTNIVCSTYEGVPADFTSQRIQDTSTVTRSGIHTIIITLNIQNFSYSSWNSYNGQCCVS